MTPITPVFRPPVVKIIDDIGRLTPKLQGAAQKAGLRAVVKPLAKEVRSVFPRKTGRTRKDIGFRVNRAGRDYIGIVGSRAIGKSASREYIMRFLEHGTKYIAARHYFSNTLTSYQSRIATLFYKGMADYLDKHK